MKVYTYQKCSTCTRATRWLRSQKIDFEELPIRETPPSTEELRAQLAFQKGNLRKLFNSSGMDYREMGLKDALPNMPLEEALELLSTRGNLVKRPFVISDKRGLVGFNEAEWEVAFAWT